MSSRKESTPSSWAKIYLASSVGVSLMVSPKAFIQKRIAETMFFPTPRRTTASGELNAYPSAKKSYPFFSQSDLQWNDSCPEKQYLVVANLPVQCPYCGLINYWQWLTPNQIVSKKAWETILCSSRFQRPHYLPDIQDEQRDLTPICKTTPSHPSSGVRKV